MSRKIANYLNEKFHVVSKTFGHLMTLWKDYLLSNYASTQLEHICMCFHKDNFYLSFLHKNFYGLVGSNGSGTPLCHSKYKIRTDCQWHCLFVTMADNFPKFSQLVVEKVQHWEELNHRPLTNI